MRARAIALPVLLLLFAGIACWGGIRVYQTRNQVVLTEEVRYGEPAAADGLRMTMRTTYDHQLFWDTEVVKQGEAPLAAETAFRFTSTRWYESGETEFEGLLIDNHRWDLDPLWDTMTPENGIERAYWELAQTAEAGEEVKKVIRLADYMTCYSLYFDFDFPDLWKSGYSWDEKQQWEQERSQMLQSYFQIPVLADETCEINLMQSEDGEVRSFGNSTTESDFFTMNGQTVMTEQGCYLVFDAHSHQGTQMDTSLLPDGFGIFLLPYERDADGNICDLDIDGLDVVYPLDPAVIIDDFVLSADGTRMLLRTIEDGKLMLTVIDAETMETVQKLTIEEGWCDSYGMEASVDYIRNGAKRIFALMNQGEGSCDFYDMDTFLTYVLYDTERVVVLTKQADGSYGQALECPIWTAEIESFPRLFDGLTFDGRRLAVTGSNQEEFGQNCEPFVAVYDENGMQYYGVWHSSLDTGKGLNYEYACRMLEQNPLTIRWSENAI